MSRNREADPRQQVSATNRHRPCVPGVWVRRSHGNTYCVATEKKSSTAQLQALISSGESAPSHPKSEKKVQGTCARLCTNAHRRGTGGASCLDSTVKSPLMISCSEQSAGIVVGIEVASLVSEATGRISSDVASKTGSNGPTHGCCPGVWDQVGPHVSQGSPNWRHSQRQALHSLALLVTGRTPGTFVGTPAAVTKCG